MPHPISLQSRMRFVMSMSVSIIYAILSSQQWLLSKHVMNFWWWARHLICSLDLSKISCSWQWSWWWCFCCCSYCYECSYCFPATSDPVRLCRYRYRRRAKYGRSLNMLHTCIIMRCSTRAAERVVIMADGKFDARAGRYVAVDRRWWLVSGGWWLFINEWSRPCPWQLMASFTSRHIIKFIVIHAFSPLHHLIHPSVGHINLPAMPLAAGCGGKTNSMRRWLS